MTKEEIINYLNSRYEYHLHEYLELYGGLLRSRSVCRHMYEHQTLYEDVRFFDKMDISEERFLDYLRMTLQRLEHNVKRHKEETEAAKYEHEHSVYDCDNAREYIMYKTILEEELKYLELVKELVKYENELHD